MKITDRNQLKAFLSFRNVAILMFLLVPAIMTLASMMAGDKRNNLILISTAHEENAQKAE